MTSSFRRSHILLAAAGCVVLPSLAIAQTYTWVGNALAISDTTLWSAAENWNPDILPPADSNVQIGTGFFSGLNINVFGSNAVNNLVVDTNQSFNLISTDPTNYQLIVLSSISRTAASQGTQTISAPINLNASTNPQIQTGGNGELLITGNISASSQSLTVDGDGTLEFDGSFNNQVTLAGGNFIVNSDAALGGTGNNLTLSGGTLINSADFATSRSFLVESQTSTIAPPAGHTLTLNGLTSYLNFGASLAKAGDGTLVINGVSGLPSFSASGGTVVFGPGSMISSGSTSLMTFTDCVLGFNNNVTANSTITFATAGTIDTGSYTCDFIGGLTGSSGITKIGSGTLILTANNVYHGGTTIDGGTVSVSKDSNLGADDAITLNGGTLQITASTTLSRNIVASGNQFAEAIDTGANSVSVGNVTGSGGFNKIGTGTLTVNSLNSAQIFLSAGTVVIADGPTVNRISQLNMAKAGNAPAAQLDLRNNSLIIDYTDTSPLSTIQLLLMDGFANGAWTGTGIVSSSAITNHKTAIGFAEASDLHLSSFGGQSVDSTSLLLKYTYAGDSNLDGKVDVTDLGSLASHWQHTGDWFNGDFNYDGTVNVTDLGILASNWQQGVSSPLGPDSFQQAMETLGLSDTLVPEPASLVMLAIGVAGFVRRNRRSARQI